MEMPRYQCHKRVWALKIAAIEYKPEENVSGVERAWITPADAGYGPFPVGQAYLMKHQPQAGGYYVVSDDGYQSFSPAKAFEAGYTRISGT